MSGRATSALLGARLGAERRTLGYAAAACAVVAAIAPAGLEAPLVFCCLVGIVIALLQSPGRHPHLEACEQSAPLYGRELARARALVPCIAVAIATASYGAVTLIVHGAPLHAAAQIGAALVAAVPASLTALCATIRSGSARLLYVAMACAVAAIAYALVAIAGSFLAEAGFCAVAAFFALRQYGEALARYDPVPL